MTSTSRLSVGPDDPQAHAAVVHARRYAGHLVEDDQGSRVQWDRRVGSYDQLLAALAARQPA